MLYFVSFGCILFCLYYGAFVFCHGFLADFDDFCLKAVGRPAQPPAGQVDGRRLIFPTDYELTKAHAKNQLFGENRRNQLVFSGDVYKDKTWLHIKN